MTTKQKAGGIAALVAAATFLIGIAMFATLLIDYTSGNPTPAESVTFVADHQVALYLWNMVIFIIFGIALVPLVLALHDRLKAGAPGLSQGAAAFGMIWAGLVLATGMITNIGLGTVADLADKDPAQAASVWSSLDAVQNGLGGGNEIAGGVWVLLVSLAALQAGTLPRAMTVLGIVSGAAGLVTVVPLLEPVGLVFGLGLIAWFVGIGVVMMREPGDVLEAS